MSPIVDTVDAGEALAAELALLDDVADAPDQRRLWLWQSPRALVVPRKLAVKPEFDAVAATLTADGWPVHVRATGGDATPQGPGIVNVTHVYVISSKERLALEAEYAKLCGPIETALGPGGSRGWQPGAFCDGAYNVQWNGLKFAGTAMRFRPVRSDRSRFAVLAHALMLMTPPTTAMIDAINTLLAALGEPRVIDPAAHTGLPEGLSQEVFLTRLLAAFDDGPFGAPLDVHRASSPQG